MKEIALRQIVPIFLNFANGDREGDIQFALRFSPDSVIVRQITYTSQSDTVCDVFQVQTNMVDDQILFTFPVINNTTGPAGTFYAADAHMEFNLQRKFINNNYQVQVMNSAGALIGASAQGVLAFILEFIRYKD